MSNSPSPTPLPDARAAFERALDEYANAKTRAAFYESYHDAGAKRNLADNLDMADAARAELLRLYDARPAASARETAHATLDRFASLKDNWDSYGALATTPLAIASAHRVVNALAHEPQAVPTGEGGVQLEWHHAGTEVELRIRPDGSADEWGEFAPARAVAPPPGEEP